jgi:glutathione S-transferase
MLKLYYARPSLYARPVWLALLEKQIPFELVPVDLGGEQFEPEFLALNPFSHVPVLVDGEFRVIESLAILDYLEAKYSQPALLPSESEQIARVRMVQLVTLNELLPAIAKLMMQDEVEYAKLRAINTLNFLEQMLGDSTYFAGDQLTLAEIVAGTFIHRVGDLGIAINDYPKLQRWSDRLMVRSAWQQIQLSEEEWQQFKRRIRLLPRAWQSRRKRQLQALSQTLDQTREVPLP